MGIWRKNEGSYTKGGCIHNIQLNMPQIAVAYRFSPSHKSKLVTSFAVSLIQSQCAGIRWFDDNTSDFGKLTDYFAF